jgi:signal transduction histidine kinase
MSTEPFRSAVLTTSAMLANNSDFDADWLDGGHSPKARPVETSNPETTRLEIVLPNGVGPNSDESVKYAELQARVTELEQFAARVAHEILGPVQAVSLGLWMLERVLSTVPKASELLARTRRSLGRVQLIVDELLRFALAGAKPAPGERVNLQHVVKGVREDLAPIAEAAGVSLTIEPVPNVQVACCEAGVIIVLQNLIRNAIKYIGDAARKQVVARAAMVAGAVRLVVQDSGPGIPSGSERVIFEPYFRAAGNHQPGIGLGLATVKRIVEAHGGRVGVNSSPGNGACFWVDIPVAT